MAKRDSAPEWAGNLGRAFGKCIILMTRTAVVTLTVLLILWMVGVL